MSGKDKGLENMFLMFSNNRFAITLVSMSSRFELSCIFSVELGK